MRLVEWTLITVLLFSCPSYAITPTVGDGARVRGIVSDLEGGVLTDASLEVEGDGGSFRAQTDHSGKYIVELPAGTYRMRATRPGFYESLRPPFTLKKNANVEFDFALMVGASIDKVYIGSDALPVPPSSEVDQYNNEELNSIRVDGLNPWVGFGKREIIESTVRYSGPVRGTNALPVIFMYDLETVRASMITYFPGRAAFKGNGNVEWSDGGTTRHGSEVQIEFLGGHLRIKLTN
jgi:hypothetical protein